MKLYKDIPRMKTMLRIIEQYNNFKQLGGTEEIIYLRERVDKLLEIKDTQKLIEEFTWCAKMLNMFYDEIEPDFKSHVLEEIQKEREDL